MNIELKITLWALACAYAIGNSFLYSWSFWSTFDINILQFASFSDIFPSILYTIAIPCIVAIIGFASVDFWERLKSQAYTILEKEIAARIKYYEDLKKVAIIFSSTAMGIAGVILLITFYISNKKIISVQAFASSEVGQILIPILISFAAIFLITKKTNFLQELKITRQLAIIIICFIPSVCFIWGQVNSKNIKNGVNTFLIESDGKCKSHDNVKYRYISSISDKVFAMSLTDNSVCIFKYDSLKLTPEKRVDYMNALPSNNI
ncbi:hypothetical protein [Enterobacter hormaechei]|uniref:hypothetical protein n=1 Tax=Enterobacter hormaechei TaxID=158836 RepID=UPI0013FD55CF|nr:hypothetical protein [Enterobacter hormaechei]